MLKRFSLQRWLLICLLVLAAGGCGTKEAGGQTAEIAVANSYLLAAVRDLCGEETEILSLVPPGMCPGHFDISPGQVNQLCHCKMLLVFGFQSNLEGVVSRIQQNGLKTHKVCIEEGLCLPSTYLSVVKYVAGILTEEFPERRTDFEMRIGEIEARLKQLESELLSEMDRIHVKQTPVLASVHQAEFARWLGFDVVSTFSGGDTETASQINESLKKVNQYTVGYIIANQQEGTALANALARRLDAQMAVFSNFPTKKEQTAGLADFDAMLRDNVQTFSEWVQ